MTAFGPGVREFVQDGALPETGVATLDRDLDVSYLQPATVDRVATGEAVLAGRYIGVERGSYRVLR